MQQNDYQDFLELTDTPIGRIIRMQYTKYCDDGDDGVVDVFVKKNTTFVNTHRFYKGRIEYGCPAGKWHGHSLKDPIDNKKHNLEDLTEYLRQNLPEKYLRAMGKPFYH